MISPLSPQDLPGMNSAFIGYGPEERVKDPKGHDVLTVRAQVFVRYYPEIKILKLETGGINGNQDDLLTVHFDPLSVGLEKPIKGHMDKNDPAAAVLRNAFDNDRPVAVAIETQRKRKNKSSGLPISPLTPIHALRGADHPNGQGSNTVMMGPSAENTTNRVAFVLGRPTKHLLSDPSEWQTLVGNSIGELPPEGWVSYSDDADWKLYGAAVKEQRPTGQAGAAGTPEQVTAVIQRAIAQALGRDGNAFYDATKKALLDIFAERDEAAERSADANPTGRPINGKFREGTPWEARANNGKANLGHYAVRDARCVFQFAFDSITANATFPLTDDDYDAAVAQASTASDAILAIADAVQSAAYGGIIPDRRFRSHQEAVSWVKWTIRTKSPIPTDPALMDDWAQEVKELATEQLAAAGERFSAALIATSDAEKAAKAEKAEANRVHKPVGPDPKVINAFLTTLTSLRNRQQVEKMSARATESGYNDLAIGVTGMDGDTIQASYPGEGGTIRDLLVSLWRRLPDANAGSPTTPPSPASPASPSSPASPEQEATTPVAHAEAHTDPVDTITSILCSATTAADVKTAYETARKNALLHRDVTYLEGPNGVRFGGASADGYVACTIGQAIEMVMTRVDTATAPKSSPQSTETLSAQQIADKAPQATVKQIDALIRTAAAANLLDSEITAAGATGPLGTFLNNRRTQAQRAER